MAEEILINSHATKSEKYAALVPQIKALLDGETDLIANLANTVAALKQGLGFFWVGFYVVKGTQLVLAPFQGAVACTRIAFDKGVCGYAYRTQKSVIVPDVEQFDGHIACSSLSKSEIVVPVVKNGKVLMVLDVDSDQIDDFDVIDQQYLEEICQWLATLIE